MRKLIIAVVILLAANVESFAGVTIGLTVEFGHKDLQGNCVEKGFCKIGVTVGGTKSLVAGHVNDNDGSLEMTFRKSASTKDVLDYQFTNNVFDIPADYVLPADVCSKLGIEKYTVRKGKYKVVETSDQYTIIFTKK